MNIKSLKLLSPVAPEGGNGTTVSTPSSQTPSAAPSQAPSGGTPQGGAPASTPAAAPAKVSTAQRLFDSSIVKPAAPAAASTPATPASAAPAAGQPPAPPAGTPPAVPAGIAPEMLKEIVTSVATAMKPAAVPAQPQQPTQEEFDRAFNVFRPTAEHLQRIRSEDPNVAVTAYHEMFQGAVKQATTIASYQIAQQMEQIQQLVAPALAMANEKNMEAMKTDFFKAYPDLNGLDQLLLQVKDSFVQRGLTFASKDEAFKAVAEAARNVLKTIPGYQQPAAPSAQPAGNQPPAPVVPPTTTMPTLSGGQGSVATPAGGAAPAAGNTAKRIFG